MNGSTQLGYGPHDLRVTLFVGMFTSPLFTRWLQATKSIISGTNTQALTAKADSLKEEVDEAMNKVEVCKVPPITRSLASVARWTGSGTGPARMEILCKQDTHDSRENRSDEAGIAAPAGRMKWKCCYCSEGAICSVVIGTFLECHMTRRIGRTPVKIIYTLY